MIFSLPEERDSLCNHPSRRMGVRNEVFYKIGPRTYFFDHVYVFKDEIFVELLWGHGA